MKRSLLLVASLVTLAAVVWPTIASARIVELGQTATPLTAPACPSNVKPVDCTIILTRTTALETLRDAVVHPTMAQRAGEIVAFTVGLSALSSSRTTRKQFIHNLDSQFGGVTLAAVTVLRPVPHRRLQWKVIAESPVVHLEPYLGEVVQFPLQSNLPVQKGDLVALTTPTWAPVLSINQDSKKFAYRQSRGSGCSTPPGTQTAQSPGDSAAYGCNYRGTRIEYSATEVVQPVPPKNYVHSGDRP